MPFGFARDGLIQGRSLAAWIVQRAQSGFGVGKLFFEVADFGNAIGRRVTFGAFAFAFGSDGGLFVSQDFGLTGKRLSFAGFAQLRVEFGAPSF